MDPLITSGLIIGGSSLIGGLLNSSSADRANRESARQFAESMKFQKYQYEDQKKYNSAVNQMSRLKQAGLNPGLAYGDGSAGSVGSVSSPSPSTFHPVDYSGIMSGAAGVADAISSASLNKSVEEVNQSQKIKNRAESFNTMLRNYTQYDKDVADIYRMRKSGDLSREQANSEIAKRQPMLDLMRSEMDLNQQRTLLEEENVKTQMEITAQQNIRKKIMELQLSREPEKLQAELNFLASQSFNQYAQGFLARANAKSIEELTPIQKQKLSQEYFESFSRELLNKQNTEYLKKKGDLIDISKWPQVGATIAGAVASGVLSGVGLGKFVKGMRGAKKIIGFAK